MLNMESRELTFRSKVVHCVNIRLSTGLAHSVCLHQILNIEHAKKKKNKTHSTFQSNGELVLGAALMFVL